MNLRDVEAVEIAPLNSMNYQVESANEFEISEEVVDKQYYSNEKEEFESVSENLVNLNLVKWYFRYLQRLPLLLPSEEIELARSYKQALKTNIAEAITARNKLVLGNLRLVVSMAKKYSNAKFDFPELIQEGNLGLMKAVDKYDPELGYRFSTYATWWIRQSILASISERSKMIRLPASVNELISKIRKAKESLVKELGRDPSIEEISRTLNVTPQRLVNVMAFEEQQEQISSLDGSQLDDSGGEVSLLETICDEQSHNFEELTDQTIISDFLNQAISNLLNDRESMIVRCRYGLNKDSSTLTLTELSKILKVSLERVRQIELKALSKLKSCLTLQFGNELGMVI
ncbi:MAG: RNA polymerase sigma factor RpoD/SigA [Candidatus Caenarcaniphilales bacterium]|nr:RNA polymerase sigma factor RpoD/SigA [Candidatus Caenarcaniphilales bacterium]